MWFLGRTGTGRQRSRPGRGVQKVGGRCSIGCSLRHSDRAGRDVRHSQSGGFVVSCGLFCPLCACRTSRPALSACSRMHPISALPARLLDAPSLGGSFAGRRRSWLWRRGSEGGWEWADPRGRKSVKAWRRESGGGREWQNFFGMRGTGFVVCIGGFEYGKQFENCFL